MSNSETFDRLDEIAIIGMTGRFPGAGDLNAFWKNLRDGVESVSLLSDKELEASGVDRELLRDPNYVKSAVLLEDVELFDAAFFGFNAREAEITDPQQRLFLECAWEALESAGYASETYPGKTGVYAGVGMNTYLLFNLYPDANLRQTADRFQLMIGNDKDFLATRVSYKLNLRGPSLTVQTACSTSLVAVHLAAQSLLNGECDMALAGGVSIRVPQKTGYLYQAGGIFSPDGHCRAFDAKAQGTMFGSGVGIVVLKRLPDALADGDFIHAVIKGSAINNDGSLKVGYTAPAVDSQAEVIAEVHALIGIAADTITYVETHGTGTPMGDPIEITALTQAFRATTSGKGFCALGSVKTNIGHLDTAAGVAGLIKTVLALKHRQLPPSLHFTQPNPRIDLANSPFYINSRLADWPSGPTPRRAGVSSFGIGGTNAHVVLEEAPRRNPAAESRPWQLLTISAQTDAALQSATARLADHLEQHPEINLADVAYTLHVGRRSFKKRRMLVCQNLVEAREVLTTHDVKRVLTGSTESSHRPVVFMFPGQGSQYVHMGRGLYESEPTFRDEINACSEILQRHLELDLRDVLYPSDDRAEQAEQQLNQTVITQPAIFAVEYALAKLLMRWGLRPEAMIGHSIGEYVAACLAGVFSLDDALAMLAQRGRLMQQLPAGVMLAIPLPEQEVQSLLGPELSLAASNASSVCIVSGPSDAVDQLEHQLDERGVGSRRLHTSHAFHSEMMDPILEPFTRIVERVELKPPQIPYVSNVSGIWITAGEATDPRYWARHLRETVRFAAGVNELLRESERVFLEVGPGRTLSDLVKRVRHPAAPVVLSTMRPVYESQHDGASVLNALGQLWLTGVELDWTSFHAHKRRQRLPLPTYPFERKRYWIEPQRPMEEVRPQPGTSLSATSTRGKPNIDDWFHIPTWQRSAPLETIKVEDSEKRHLRWLVFLDECGLGSQLAQRLEGAGDEVITVTVGGQFTTDSNHAYTHAYIRAYTIDPKDPGGYDALLTKLRSLNKLPSRIIHLWSVTPTSKAQPTIASYEKAQCLGFYSLLYLAQALGRQNATDPLSIDIVSTDLQAVTGEETLCPEKATVLGPCRVIPQEYPYISCRSIDVKLADSDPFQQRRLINQLFTESMGEESDSIVAYRGAHRWVQKFEAAQLQSLESSALTDRLRVGGVYLITGGLGGIGLVLAEHIAQTAQTKLGLLGRSALPEKHEWEEWLTTHSEEDVVSSKIRKLQRLEELGAELLIVRGDVANADQMRDVVTQTRARFGEINGVIHAAGIAGGGMIQLKEQTQADNVLDPKVKGTLLLDQLLEGRELDFFVLCSSVNAIVGGYGQVDYCAANAFLDAYAHYKNANSDRLVVSINWDTWQEVGMAVDAVRQLEGSFSKNTSHNKATIHPLLGTCVEETSEQETYAVELTVAEQWALSEHRIIAGEGVMPGTAYLEMARAAFAQHAGDSMVELRDVFFVTPLRLGDNEAKQIQTTIRKNGAGFEFLIRSNSESHSESKHNEGPDWQVHACGQIFVLKPEALKNYDLKGLRERCNDREIVVGETERNRINERGFGARWHSVKRVYLGTNEILASLELAEEFSADLEKYKLHPALLDVATGFAQFYVADKENYLPLSYGNLKIKGPLPRNIYSYVSGKNGVQEQNGLVKYDVVVMDEHGVELLEIREFTLRKMPNARQTINDWPIERNFNGEYWHSSVNNAPSNPAAVALQNALIEGIRSEEGVEAFRRVLAKKLSPQVVVCTKDLQALKEQTILTPILFGGHTSRQPGTSKATHSRPELNVPYVAPTGALEPKLAEIWQELLGVDRVGVNDNFFELGGDSVVAIQVIARVGQAGLRLTPPQFFQQPTVAGLAAIAEPLHTPSDTPEIVEGLPDFTEKETYIPEDFPLAGLDAQALSELSTLIERIDQAE